jgi:hypothetical protein
MNLYGVIAVLHEGGNRDNNYKCALLCGMDESFNIIEGEWFGYIKNIAEIHPFVLRNENSFFYGGEEHTSERTNIGDRLIQPGI